MAEKEKTYTREEMDIIMLKHIEKNSEVLKKNLREKRKKSEVVDYV